MLDPRSECYQLMLYAFLKKTGHQEDNIRSLRQLIVRKPTKKAMKIAQCFLGTVLTEVQHLEGAIDCFNTAIKLDPQRANSYYSLAFALAQQGKFEEAVVAGRQGAALDPKSALGQNHLGGALINCGQHEEAIVCF
jgi:tetratricopeptide (TPR) repeat protein